MNSTSRFISNAVRPAALLLLLLSGTAMRPSLLANGGHTPPFESVSCPAQFPAGIRVDCGFLVVRENGRNHGEGRSSSRRKIRIAVAIARASSGRALPDPILFVPGGPGAAAIDPGTIVVLSTMFGANRDVIFVDPRGTGLACRPTAG